MFSVLTSKIFGGLALALLILVGMQSCQIDRLTTQRDKAKLLAEQTQIAFDQTVADYRAAAAEAERLQKANLDRVKAERDTIDERTINDFKTARDASDARYRRLLASAAEADSSRAADPDLSAVTDAACESFTGTSCDRLPSLLLEAQRNTDTLIALQNWVRDQAEVDTNPLRNHSH